MKPYGNEGMHHEDNRNSTKTGQTASKCKRESRRINKKIRRAKDKVSLKREISKQV